MAEHSDAGRRFAAPDVLAHLRVATTGLCWWCQARPATTGEHKFKRTDLSRLMPDDGLLVWGDTSGNTREIRGKSGVKRDRYRVIKFPKSLCEPCNNQRSKPLDTAYEQYAVHAARAGARFNAHINFARIFGPDWTDSTLSVARYYGKHFGCRMVDAGIPVPASLRAFLDGANDMPDARMVLVTTNTINDFYNSGLSISPVAVEADRELTRFVRCVLVAYIGPIGVRYEWRADPIQDGSQFFHYPTPVTNWFKDELAVINGDRRQALIGALSRYVRRLGR